jgi:nitrite reductase (NADH) small subunit
MSRWVRLCGVADAPAEGGVCEQEVDGKQICLARVDGELRAVDNLCPHRQGPLGQGWIEGAAVVCPWHSWAFDLRTGQADYPAGERVDVYALQLDGEDVFVEIP